MIRPPTFAFHKPWGVLSRFTADGSAHRTLAEFGFPKDVWPIGRLDADSEGLLIVSGDKRLVDALLNPRRDHEKTYAALVERVPNEQALQELRCGVLLDGAMTKPARAWLLDDDPGFAPRDPPVRVRKSVPDAWLSLSLTEGKNRQVRRMTAAVGHPTLRLVRTAIGAYALGALGRGDKRLLDEREVALLTAPAPPERLSGPPR